MRIGSLFSGAGGLDMAVEQVFGATTAWHCELDPAASKVLAHRWPGVPNLGDITQVDWTAVEPVDIICGGWPCQPFSLAGQRKGADDERALWPYVARAVRMVRPRIVVLENVSAVLGPEFQRVANDLAACGYDIAWRCLRASDVGAPHRRERLFVLATDAADYRCDYRDYYRDNGAPLTAVRGDSRVTHAHSSRDGRHEGWPESARLVGGSDAAVGGAGPVELLPTPTAQAAKHGGNSRFGGGNGDVSNLWQIHHLLLPTPTSRDGKGANQRGDDTCLTGALLPTPSVADGMGGHMNRSGDRKGELLLPGQVRELAGSQWGKYEPAIHRWETLTRPAPAPTEPNTKGNPRLAAAFSEWMLGWPDGWVTAVPGISRNDALRIVGNGVVDRCAEVAIRWLLTVSAQAA